MALPLFGSLVILLRSRIYSISVQLGITIGTYVLEYSIEQCFVFLHDNIDMIYITFLSTVISIFHHFLFVTAVSWLCLSGYVQNIES